MNKGIMNTSDSLMHCRYGLRNELRMVGEAFVKKNNSLPTYQWMDEQVKDKTYSASAKSAAKHQAMKALREFLVEFRKCELIKNEFNNWKISVELWFGTCGPVWKATWQGNLPKEDRSEFPFSNEEVSRSLSYSLSKSVSEREREVYVYHWSFPQLVEGLMNMKHILSNKKKAS